MKQKIYAFPAELVPDAMRGEEMGRRQWMTGVFSGHLDVIYEHVTITQTESGSNDTITEK